MNTEIVESPLGEVLRQFEEISNLSDQECELLDNKLEQEYLLKNILK